MRVGWLSWVWWRFVAVPLAVWLLLTAGGAAALLSAQNRGRAALVQRFELRLSLVRDFVTSYVADLIEREQVQAQALLADPVVSQRDFSRSVAGFGYPAALLLDDRGRLLRAVPADTGLAGQDLTGRYAHLRTVVEQGRPAVSQVVPSAVSGEPVVSFAVPFDAGTERRVFAGAVAITHSALSSYLSTVWTLNGIRVQLVDRSGLVVASNRTVDAAAPSLAAHDPALAGALGRDDRGRYQADGRPWRYASMPIPGAPWRLSATVPEDVLLASEHDNEIAGRVAVATAAGVGLLVVVAAARARRHRRELQLSEQRFRQLFDNSRIGMIISDPRGRFLRVNPAFGRIVGRPSEELVGKHFADITHPDDTGTGMGVLADVLAGRFDSFELEKRYGHADGHVIEVIVTSTLLRGPGGEPRFFATQIIDVTERRSLERARDQQQAELADRAEQLERANAQMADFITMLTHDVRQPLGSIVARGELLIEEWPGLPEHERIRYVRQMTTAGHRADHLVDEILTLARLDAGAIVARPVRVDLSHAVLEAVAAHGPGPEHPITVLAPDQTIALADPAHLQLILGNLLANAIKYGSQPVTVTLTNHSGHVEIQITDSGEGVPRAFVPHLFERFTRADTGVAVNKSGTGLGLYLARQLAEAGGLTVGYRPHRPHGASFIVTIPRSPQPNTAGPAATPEQQQTMDAGAGQR